MLKYNHDLDLQNKNSLSLILQRIQPHTRVLEFGPATGYMTKYLTEELHCKVYCVEVDPESAKIAEKYCEKMIVADLDEMAWIDSLQGEIFDYLIFADVLEHLNDPWTVLKKATDFLSPNGQVITSIPNISHNAVVMELLEGNFDYRSLGLLDDTHIRFFTRKSIIQLLNQAGLQPIYFTGTVASPEETEFKKSYSLLPLPIRKFLMQNTDGHVYQFIAFSKRMDELNDEEKSIKFEIDQVHYDHLIMQLFWEENGVYSEENSLRIPLNQENEFHCYEINIPKNAQNTLNTIRIDPINVPSYVVIKNISIWDGTNCILEEASHLLRFGNGCFILKQDDALHIVCSDYDPQIFLSLPVKNVSKLILEMSYSEEILPILIRRVETLQLELEKVKKVHKELADALSSKEKEHQEIMRLKQEELNVLEALIKDIKRDNDDFKEELDFRQKQYEDAQNVIRTLEEANRKLNDQIMQLMNSNSWKITEPLRIFGRVLRNSKMYFKDLVHLLLRKKIIPELVPIAEIKKNNESESFLWKSLGQDPQFLIRGPFPSGWTEIVLHISTNENVDGQARLYLGYGDSFSEKNSIVLGEAGKRQIRFFNFGMLIKEMRFDPFESTGDFNIEELSFRRISYAEVALKRFIKRVNMRYEKYYKFILFSYTKAQDWKKKRGRYPNISEFPLLVRKAVNEWKSRQRTIDNIQPPSGFVLENPMEPYQAWLEVNEWNQRRETLLKEKLQKLTQKPLLSVIMPVYNPPIEFLEKAILSVYNQVYDNWELCIADDASTDPNVKEVLKKWSDKDSRIQVVFSEKNGNISKATNMAAQLAQGQYLVLMDNDDELTPDALGEVAVYISEHPETDVLYSDDDKIDTEGNRFAPQFKPDWSPELLLSFMYFSHLFVIRTELFRQVGGMRVGFEGSQDYDLALRVTELARHVGHIPKILYHWRVLPGSTASSGSAKPSSFEAGRKAVQEALDRRGISAKVVQPEWAKKAGCGIYSHIFPDNGPKVAIIIPTKNQVKILKSCINSIGRTTYKNYEIIVIDNDSDDPETLSYLKSIPHKVLKISNPNGKFSYAYINNRAVEETDAEYVLFLNNDTEIRSPEWLSQMVGYLGIPGIGAVGARLLFPDGRIQHAGITHGLYNGMAGPSFKLMQSWDNGYLSLAAVTRNCLAVTAACLLTPRKLFLELGGFDEKSFAVAYNDVDYCYRLHNSGYRIVYCPTAELTHYEGYSRGFADNPAEGAAFRRKYKDMIDPYYNPNLSLDNERFEIESKTVVMEQLAPIPTLMCAFNLNWEGAPYSQYELTVRLKEQGIIDPIVYCPQDGPLRRAYEEKGIQVEVFQHPLSGISGRKAYDVAIERFSEHIRKWNVELVYGNTLQTFYVIDAAKRLGLPSIWNPRESEPWQTYFDHFGPDIATKALYCFNYPYKIVFVANATKNGFLPLNLHHNFTTIHNGLDRNRFMNAMAKWPREKARQHYNIDSDEIVVLLLGTVCERKGQIDLIQALGLLEQELVHKRVTCFIVGDRPSEYSEKLKSTLDSLNPSVKRKVNIIPETSDTALYFSLADIFVCSSRVESFPRVILEAMACGLPIVTTPVFGIVEQVQENINGLFYQPGDVKTLSKHLETLIENEGIRKVMATNSTFVIDMITDYESMAKSYGNIFKEAWLSGRTR